MTIRNLTRRASLGSPTMRALLYAARRRRISKFDGTIVGATQANPVVISTQLPHGLDAGDTVLIKSISGMTEINNREFTVTSPDRYTFALQGEDGTAHTEYTSGGRFRRTAAI